MKLTIEDQSIFENEDYVNGLKLIIQGDKVLVQIGDLSTFVNLNEIQNFFK